MDGSNVWAGREDRAPVIATDLATSWLPRGLNRRRQGGEQVFLGRDLSEHALQQPRPISYSQAELDAARQEGFESGRQAGLTDASMSHEAAIAEALAVVAARSVDARLEAARVVDEAAAALAAALLAAMRAVVPELIRQSGLTEAGAMLAQVLPGLSREPELLVEVRPELRAGIAALVGRLEREGGQIAVQGREDLADAEVRVRWSAGQARRDPLSIWQAVVQMLEPVSGAQHPTTMRNTDAPR